MLWLLLLGCPGVDDDDDVEDSPREEPDVDVDTDADTDGDADADTDTDADTDADTDTDTGEPPAPFVPSTLYVKGAFTVLSDGTIGTMTNRGTEWPPTVWIVLADARYFETEDDRWLCTTELIATSSLTLQEWTATDDSADPPVDLVHHGVVVSPSAAEISSDCPEEVDRDAILAWEWGVGVGRMTQALEDDLVSAGVDPDEYYGAGTWAGDPAGSAYAPVNIGFGFEIDAAGELARDDDGYGIYLDTAAVGDAVPGPGYYQVVGGYWLDAEVLFP
jgi:hypothetical protein